MKQLSVFSRKEYLLKQKNELNRHVFGIFPVQYPKEILWALNILPVEIWDPPLEVSNANTHLQPYICSVVRLGLELILQGKCKDLDGFLFPHTCDSIQNMASIVNDYLGIETPCYFFYHPKAPYKESARSFYVDQLKNLAARIGKQVGTLKTDELEKYVEKGRKISSLVKELYEIRSNGMIVGSNLDFYKVIRQGEFLHPDDFIPLLEEYAVFLKKGDRSVKVPSVILSGIMPNPPEILSLLDDMGIIVSDDDLACCGRRFGKTEIVRGDPFEIMADAYFKMPPCSTKDSPADQRFESIINKVEATSAKGVIFNMVKFCEPELFDVPYLVEELKKKSIPTLVIDTELNQGLSGQLKTRIEAFIEIIS